MAKINITIQIDEKLKKQAEEFFSGFGLSISTAFIAFVEQSVREQRIPFMLSRNALNQATFEAIEETHQRENLSKSFTSVQILMNNLNADK